MKGLSMRHGRSQALTYAVVVPATLVVLIPYAWMLATSVKEDGQILSNPPVWLPIPITLRHYSTVLFETPIPRYFLNSLEVAMATSMVAVLIGSLAGYGFSRFKFRGRSALILTVVFTQMFPLAVLLIPLFILWRQVGLFDTPLSLILTYLAFALPLGILLLRSYFGSIPPDLEAAAMVDGCSRLGAFLRIVLPLSLPALSAAGLYTFLAAWQEYMFALAFITTESNRTVPIGMGSLATEHSVDWGGMMAAATLFTLPVVALFLALQRFFTSGMTMGGVRG